MNIARLFDDKQIAAEAVRYSRMKTAPVIDVFGAHAAAAVAGAFLEAVHVYGGARQLHRPGR